MPKVFHKLENSKINFVSLPVIVDVAITRQNSIMKLSFIAASVPICTQDNESESFKEAQYSNYMYTTMAGRDSFKNKFELFDFVKV